MKNNLLRTFFEWALITSVLMSVGFFVWFWIKSHQLRDYSSQMVVAQSTIQNNHAFMTLLINDCHEYAKTNADMARFLESERAPAAAPAAPAVTNKPRSK
jgi:hypothetical protein